MNETQNTAWKFTNTDGGTLEIGKDDGGIADFRIGFQKAVEKTSGKILALIKENNYVTILELAEKIGVTERTVERNLQ
ncbi:MAG: winged helix-turn-helix transcriptional regulator [Saprospiraceae bacterium]|jgi:predicted HTH transcriptional regulator|nr:winged helix-turn-helix transcriptional regulator [Saprospiraceae bacterium]MDP4819830.1 winged helix-turn-helix transcriptional regulator [Saprospiraceae bacterium]MDP4997510.1 winged helix-turn-helix transcriptional regulator [Saprospiraceae bacterium]